MQANVLAYFSNSEVKNKFFKHLLQMTGTLTFVIVPGPGANAVTTATTAAVTGAVGSSAAAKEHEVPETVVRTPWY